jgi:hypothetical protein
MRKWILKMNGEYRIKKRIPAFARIRNISEVITCG